VIRTRFTNRRRAAVLVGLCAAALASAPAFAQQGASIAVNPASGAPGSQFTITLKNYHACAPDSPNCILIDFLQAGRATVRIGTADSHGAPSFTGTLTVPPTAVGGAATIHAYSNTDDEQTFFTVSGAPAPTTTTTAGPGTTTTSSSTSTTSTTVAVTTTVTTVVLSPTTTTGVPVTAKKSSSHSDVPRYIAVALVVAAAAATAAVDTRLRRMKQASGAP